MNAILLPSIFGILFGLICRKMARKNGRREMLWFTIGFFFGLFGLITLALIGGKNKIKAKKTMPKEPKLQKPATYPFAEGKLWFFLDREHKQKGPLSSNAIAKSFKKEELSLESYVWHEGIGDWKKIKELIPLI